MTRHFSMIRSFHTADLFTLANAACGTGAIFLSMAYTAGEGPSKIYAACIALLFAVTFDFLDGRVARWRHGASPLGRELDSLADAVSFGVAPACLARAVGFTGTWDTVVLLFFVGCGISRLARYNITSESLSDDSGKVGYFEGTPITTSFGLVVFLAILAALGRVGSELPGGALTLPGGELHPLVLLYAVSGSLMISKTLRIPKP